MECWKINEKRIDDRYPIPNISRHFRETCQKSLLYHPDLASEFQQIEIFSDNIKKTAFNVENGHYECQNAFWPKNALATFQRVMSNVIKEYLNRTCLIYMNDLLVWSTSLQEHLVNLKKILQNCFKII